MADVKTFYGPYRFLSNFWPSMVEYEGVCYPTVEHAYQAAKSVDVSVRATIRDLSRPGDAKKAARKISLRPDWETVKVGIMESLVRSKFEDPTLKEKLKSTGDGLLEEGNNWNDTFWGVCRGKGKNHLGRILMKVRDDS